MEQNINEASQNANEIISKATQSTGCKTCKSGGLSSDQSWMLALSILILITSVYGTIEIIKDIFSFFK